LILQELVPLATTVEAAVVEVLKKPLVKILVMKNVIIPFPIN
jgi:hypothetical protein